MLTLKTFAPLIHSYWYLFRGAGMTALMAVSAVVPAIEAERGTLDKYIGDGLMVLFGAPEAADDPAAKKQELIENFRKIIDVYIAAGNDMIDDVIDPRETRATICRTLELAATKHVERPWKRSGVVPV